MGLDNYITVKGIRLCDFPVWFTPVYPVNVLDNEHDQFDICYWRKCWGIRNEILSIATPFGSGDCDYTIRPDQLRDVAAILRKYMNEDYYNDNHDSIWSYEQSYPILSRQAWILIWLSDWCKTHNDVSITFIDSY